ncbi:MAG: hypothetical protein EBU07_15025 [Betaproteobacteria bacterium]|nr:hypothetical protein [Betaproteobacteria bacterium]
MTSRALVWFKRDLRLADHAPLQAAALCDQALALYVVEPDWVQSAECDAQHLASSERSSCRRILSGVTSTRRPSGSTV